MQVKHTVCFCIDNPQRWQQPQHCPTATTTFISTTTTTTSHQWQQQWYGSHGLCDGPNPSPIQQWGLSLQAPASPDNVMMKSLASPNNDYDSSHIYPSLVWPYNSYIGGVPFLDYYVIMDRLFNPFTYIMINNLSHIVLHTHQNTHWSCSVWVRTKKDLPNP